MKNAKLLPVLFLLASMLLGACNVKGPVTSSSAVQPSLANTGSAIAGIVKSTLKSISAPIANAPVSVSPQTAADVAGLQNAYEAIYQNVNPSVVTIEISSQVSTTPRGSRGSGGQTSPNTPSAPGGSSQIVPTAEGSGFIWDSAGHIVTNNHVIDGAAKISVTFSDGSTYDAKLVGADPNTDLAVIQVIAAPASLLKPITVGDSSAVKVGQLVVAIGNPYGLSNTMTTGIVSAISRSIQAGAGGSQNGASGGTPNFSIPDIIQTDAAINPGNSGGVLLDMNGELIGVPSQIESASGSNSGVGFAIPSAIVSKVAPQLISKGVAAHSYLGLSGMTITADVISSLKLKVGQQGVLVADVVAGGPSEKSGLKGTPVDANGNPSAAGDIITGIDGKLVVSFEDMVSYLTNSTQPGQTVTLNVLRDGKDIQVKVILGTQPTK